MSTRRWLAQACFGGVLLGGGVVLFADVDGTSRISSTVRTGDLNAVNSQIVIGGKSAGAADSGLVVGNGRLVSRAVPVTDTFHGIDLAGLFAAEVTCGKTAAVTLVADENLQPLFMATVRDGILRVRFTKPVETKAKMQLKIALPTLDFLQLSGGDTVKVTEVKGKRFLLTHEGTGAVTVTGKVESFVCAVSGVGEVDTGKLACDTAEITVSGVGSVTCRPATKLQATLSGIGGVRCLTRPATVEKNATGLGDVEFVGK